MEHSARLADSGAGFAPSRLFAPLGVAKIKRPRPRGSTAAGFSVCEKNSATDWHWQTGTKKDADMILPQTA